MIYSCFKYRIPKLVISGDSDDIDIDISDDQYDIQSLDISNVPVMVTVNKVSTFSKVFRSSLNSMPTCSPNFSPTTEN